MPPEVKKDLLKEGWTPPEGQVSNVSGVPTEIPANAPANASATMN